ncbi:AsmA family protein [Pedobacter nototheniae]|uniref:AsmA family protein n=1 Tax=Pedobacter nototheniae TaxID=2488994 RepID=UPI0029318B93|nr:AsmA family protein [Pedobacter nototheniae]
MARWLKISLKIIAVFAALIILIWVAGSFYINQNKKQVLNTILEQLNKNLNGKITAGSMEPTLLKGFPGVSVSLNQVVLRDSLWTKHKHDLLNAQDIDVSLNVFSLIAGDVKINRISINNAAIYVYTDSAGYSNTSIFKSKETDKKKPASKSAPLEISKIDFNKVSLILDNQKRFKLFNFDIDQIQGRIEYPDSGWTGKIKLKTFVKSFAFNTKKGSFLKDKTLEGTLSAHYSKAEDAVIINPEILNIGGAPFKIGAKIDLGKSAFAISIAVDKILFKDVALLLAPNISSKLLKFGIEKPVDIRGHIIDDGSGKYGDPLIRVGMTVRNNVVSMLPAIRLTECNFDGSFTNQDTLGGIIGDENSIIRLLKLNANYFNAPIKIDTFLVTNLSRPIATGLVTSNFPLSNLNNSLGGENFDFKNGTADVKLYCKADIDNFNFTKPVVSGKVRVIDADIMYLPRKLHLVKSALDINFTQNNLSIQNGHFQLGKSILNLNCTIDNFLNLYYTAPDKILVNLKMSSPQLYLNEFLPFLGPRERKSKSKSKSSIKETTAQLSNVLEVSKMNILLNVDRAIYQKFVAKNLNADISLRSEGIFFNKINVSNAGGTLTLNGNVKQEGNSNRFTLNSKISNVSVKDFFYSFDNFGQNTITNKNLNGYLSSLVNISGRISNTGTILPRSMDGKVIFNLRNAALVNFGPIADVGKFAFPRRNLSNIQIPKLDGTLTVKGDKVIISPMLVNSSALNFNVKGIYSLSTGTNIAMDIPLRNPKGDENLDNQQKKDARMKGIVLHLKAVDDEKGGVKIRWNKDHD